LFCCTLRAKDSDDSSGALGNTINLEEWIEIFTEGKINVASLTAIIELEYKHVYHKKGGKDNQQGAADDNVKLEVA
jgi:hypothetical protein